MKEDTNYTDIFYNEEGSFSPILRTDGNMEEDIAHIRNIYMEAERDYFNLLLSDEEIRQMFNEELLNSPNDVLFDKAITYQRRLECGELETNEEIAMMNEMSPEERDDYHMKVLARAEGIMCLLFAAIRDRARIRTLCRVIKAESKGMKK